MNLKTSALVFTGVAAITFSLLFNRFIDKSSVSPLPEITSEKPSMVYTLKEYRGKLAVFSSNEDQPLEIFDTPVSTLPLDDRRQIEEGITAVSESQLQKLIEDYTS